MRHQELLILAVVLIVIGFIGLGKGLSDKNKSKKSTCCPNSNELKMRDNQYIFMSTVAIVAGFIIMGLVYNPAKEDQLP